MAATWVILEKWISGLELGTLNAIHYYPLPTLSMDYIRRRRRIDKRSKIRYSQEDKEEEEEEEEEK